MYDYKNINIYLKNVKNNNQKVLKSINNLQDYFNKYNKKIVKNCKKQIYKNIKTKFNNPKIYVNNILNKSNKINTNKIIGGNQYNFKYIYNPYKYIISNFKNLQNKLNGGNNNYYSLFYIIFYFIILFSILYIIFKTYKIN